MTEGMGMRVSGLAILVMATGRALAMEPEFQVNTFTFGDQMYLRVAATGESAVAVWQSEGQDGDGFGIFGRRFDSEGMPISEEFQVNTWTVDDQSEPAVAGSPDGGFVVVWSSFGQDGDRGGVFGQRFDASAQPVGPEFQVNRFAANYQGRPAVAYLHGADAAFVVVWESYLTTGIHVFGQLFGPDAAPLGDPFAVEGVFVDQFFPAVAAGAEGSFVVAWSDPNFLDALLVQRFDALAYPMNLPIQVNQRSEGATSLDVCTLPTGAFVVAWSGHYVDLQTEEEIRASWMRILDEQGNPQGDESRLDGTDADDNQDGASVACHAAGNFLAVWLGRGIGSSRDVFFRRYGPQGEPGGPPVRANFFVGGLHPAVAPLGVGSFLMAWTNPDQDGSGRGVFARRVRGVGVDCVGDCDGDDCVTVDELVAGVRVALDLESSLSCVAFDTGDGRVTIDELLTGVNNARRGCR
jgi:hypothetical protein